MSEEVVRWKRAFEQSEAHRQAILDSALDCIICTDREGRVLEFNSAAERTFRMAAADAIGLDLVATIFPAGLREQYRRELFSLAAPLEIHIVGNRLETNAVRCDGAEFPAEVTVSRVVLKDTVRFIVHVRDINARKRAAQALLWLGAIVESSQDAIYGIDLKGRISSWNKGAEQMYGYATEEIVGKPLSLLIPYGLEDEISMVRGQRNGSFGKHDVETIRWAKTGQLLDVSLSVSPVFDSAKMIGVSVIARDITARKAAEEALRKATETSVYASPVPIVGLDCEQKVTLWNGAAERAFGWTEREVLGKPNPIVSPEDATEATRLYDRLFAGETVTGLEVRRRRKDGTSATISLSAAPVWDEQHRVKGIIKFLTDITEQKRSEEILRRTEENYRSIFENSPEGIYQTTPEGRYLSANPALARMLGYETPGELIEARLDLSSQEYVDPELRSKFVRLMQERGAVENFEYQAYRKDRKQIWVSENAHVVRDAEGRISYFEGTVQDITQRRELEQQVRQMQKIEAIGRLAGGLAHDFNNILMATSSFAELLGRKIPQNDPAQRYIEEIVKSTDRGSHLTQGLLAFSRKQVLCPRVLDLNLLITNQLDMLKRLIPENIELKFSPNVRLGNVRIDGGQMEQVVMNLVINARDAMLNGGEITIATENITMNRDSQSPLAAGDYVLLSVSDNGCGMDAETKSRIFEPFFTTKPPGKGTGLGLATVFGIVKQSSGYIFAHSKAGHGTTFKIYLPRSEEAIAEFQEVAASSQPKGSEIILLVEDEEAVRKSAAEYLKENGYTVLVASSGPEALDLARGSMGNIDLLVSDLVMPKMSGPQLAEKIRAERPEIKIIFMSGYSNNLLPTVENAGHVLLHKPFRLAALGACVRKILDSARKASAATAQG
ncbi:MAG TPA: PAS domain S-box protein [Terriglobales bacterium]